MTCDMLKLVGKKILHIRGNKEDGKYIVPSFILFDDEKTIVQLDEQDYYSYHDCSSAARILCVHEDAAYWKFIHDDLKRYPIANSSI